jgi:GDP-L-fucose synthase
MAQASVFVMGLSKTVYDQHTTPMQSQINIGYGSDITIAQLAQAVSQAIGYQGNIEFDAKQPDGAPRKLMDSGRLNALGWQAKVDLQQGLAAAYQDFKCQIGL